MVVSVFKQETHVILYRASDHVNGLVTAVGPVTVKVLDLGACLRIASATEYPIIKNTISAVSSTRVFTTTPFVPVVHFFKVLFAWVSL